MGEREEESFEEDYSDGEPLDTGLFDAEEIVREFESQSGDRRDAKSAAAWQRVESLLERKRLRDSLRDMYDDDFLDGDGFEEE